MRKARFVLLVAVAVVALPSLYAAWLHYEGELEFGDVGRAKELVRAEMRDPESVRFRRVGRNESFRVCGEANAKNAMGGYVGYQLFDIFIAGGLHWWTGDPILAGMKDRDEHERKIRGFWTEACRTRLQWVMDGMWEFALPQGPRRPN